MSWIDTSDKIDHDQYQIARVWSLVYKIEDIISKREGKDMMAHEIPWLKDVLRDYQDGRVKRSGFILFLTNVLDNLESGISDE